MTPPEDKTCASCGRRIEWRARWAKTWDEVRYCSDACRRRKVSALDTRLEAELRRRLAGAGRVGVDPDQVVRDLVAPDPAAEREAGRRAARRLVAAGAAEMVQGGRVVDPSTARGDVRLRAVR